jgi:hypothetical protein
MILADSGSHKRHHHYLSGGLVAGVGGNRVRLSGMPPSCSRRRRTARRSLIVTPKRYELCNSQAPLGFVKAAGIT